ncbi:MAG: UvrD-helicase domain-containing protein [Cyanobacteria bacterium P01_H01_bin.74]
MNGLLEKLNTEQLEAVQHQTGPLLVLAGAGSGKTRVLTHQIAYRIQNGVFPGEVLAVTFTNKAAKEMRLRLNQLLNDETMNPYWIGTFHSICSRILRRDIMHYTSKAGRTWTTNFVIYDDSESVAVIKSITKELNLDEKLYPFKTIRGMISGYKNQLKDAYSFASEAKDFRVEKIAQVYDQYEARLSQSNALDFDDLLLISVKLLQSNPQILQGYHDRFKHILVDEFQDTNDTQYELVRLLAEGTTSRVNATDHTHWNDRSLTVVGDIDQSIYSWRGANFRILLNFQKDFADARLIKLVQNYRSTAKILDAANAIIQQNKERLPKDLKAVKGQGDAIHCYEAADDREEAGYILDRLSQMINQGIVTAGECCILYRTNVQSRVIEDTLISRGIAYTMVGGLKFYERREIKDILAYMTVIFNDADNFSVKRILNVPRRGIGKTSLETLERAANAHQMSLYQVLQQAAQVEGLKPRAIKAVASFIAVVEQLKRLADALPLDELINQILDVSGYFLELQQDDPTDSEGRQANVKELVSVARQFIVEFAPEPDELAYDIAPDISQDIESIANPLETSPSDETESGDTKNTPGLADFLTQMALLSDIDNAEPAENKIVLMTLHACKGLEFPVVALCGLEEGLLPHFRSLSDSTQMEEERRLMYVGVTRAMDRLFITYARKRLMMGELRYNQSSRFLKEIPTGCLSGYYTFDQEPGGKRFDRDRQYENNSESRRERNGYSTYSRDRDSNTGQASDYLKNYAAKNPIRPKNPSKTVVESTFVPLAVGDQVSHEKFGSGVVSQILGQGNKAIYSIQFEGISGKKLLDPKFAKLRKL